MTAKQRDGQFRRQNMQRDKVKPRKGGAKIERHRKSEPYNSGKRNAIKAELREARWYM